MDSTPIQPPLTPCSSKLPIKRKTPHLPFLTPKLEHPSLTTTVVHDDPSARPQPSKFHRVWTEPDEITFLQGLLQSHGLSFPRDLPVFYSHFSTSTSQHYTKSQLSDKLQRLRKKFRIISSRLARGLHPSALSSHDRILFDLSKRLWSPEFSASSPFGKSSSSVDAAIGINSRKKIDSYVNGKLVGVKVCFSPDLPFGSNQDHDNNVSDGDDINDNYKKNCVGQDVSNVGEVKMNQVHVDFDFRGEGEEEVSRERNGADVGGVIATSVLNVLNDCLKDVRMVLLRQGILSPCLKDGKEMDFDRRWGEQRVAEFDVLAQRLRMVIQNSLSKQ
ncbi:hypothetical protein SLE2022_274590 [Rubroshorea leprosula]